MVKMFGELLRAHRRRTGLTQEELAGGSAVSVRNIRDLEAGRVNRPRPATVRLLADALGLTGGDRISFLERGLAAGPARLTRPTPAQLPPDTAGFVGRAAELDRLSLDPSRAAAATVWTVSGQAGVGKTSFAVHWAHRAVDRFPDGQLYVNLRGYGPDDVVPTQEAVRGFLDAFGTPSDDVPSGLTAQLNLYRSLLAGKRVLILLDNARDAAQVRPLLPAAPGCVVVVTSRNPLRGLVTADGARPIALDLLSEPEAAQLLSRRVGRDRLSGHSAAVHTIVDRCQRLPLALAVVAGRLVSEPRLAVPTVAGDLAAAGMAAFTSDDEQTDLRSVFSWSYRILSSHAARLFRLLSLPPGPDVSTMAAGALAGPVTESLDGGIDGLLAELLRTQLLVERAPGRFVMHDLLRSYAADLARRTDDPADLQAARARLLDVHLLRAAAASHLLEPFREPVDEVPPAVFADVDEAGAWLAAERANLITLVRMAAATGLAGRAWRLAWALTTYLQRHGHLFDLLQAQEAALAAAGRAGDAAGEMHAHRGLSRALFRLERYDDSRPHLHAALDLAIELDDVIGQARARHGLGYAAQQQDRQSEALEHLGEALRLFESAGHPTGAADTLNSIAWCHTLTGNAVQARDCAERAVRLLEHSGNVHGAASAADTLGRAYALLGEHRSAVACHDRAREVFHDLGDRYSEAETLRHLAEAHDAVGDPAAARSARRRSDLIMLRMDRPAAARAAHRIARSSGRP